MASHDRRLAHPPVRARRGRRPPRGLARCRRLEWLSCTGCRVGHAGLAALTGLPALQRLSLRETRVTDAAILGLASIASLRAVSLDGTEVSPVGQAELVLRRPDVEVISH